MKKVGQNDRLLWVALLADDCCRQKRVRVKILRNPTHGSGWIIQSSLQRVLREGARNPTHGSGWMLQVQPITCTTAKTPPFYSTAKAGPERSTHCRGWD